MHVRKSYICFNARSLVRQQMQLTYRNGWSSMRTASLRVHIDWCKRRAKENIIYSYEIYYKQFFRRDWPWWIWGGLPGMISSLLSQKYYFHIIYCHELVLYGLDWLIQSCIWGLVAGLGRWVSLGLSPCIATFWTRCVGSWEDSENEQTNSLNHFSSSRALYWRRRRRALRRAWTPANVLTARVATFGTRALTFLIRSDL